MKKILKILLGFLAAFSLYFLTDYLVQEFGKGCTCYGVEVDINGKKCIGFKRFCVY